MSNNKDRIIETFELHAKTHTWSQLYHDPLNSKNYPTVIRKRRVLELLEGHNGRLLDIGCGPGAMIPDLVERGWEYHGIDTSSAMIEEAQNVAKQINPGADVYLSQGEAQKLEYSSSFFDAVIAMGLIEYLSPAGINQVIAEIYRVLKYGGISIITIPKRINLENYSILLLTPLRWFAAPLARKLTKSRKNAIKRTLLQPVELDLLCKKHRMQLVDGLAYSFTPIPYPFTALLPNVTHKFNRHWEVYCRNRAPSFLASGYIGKYRKNYQE